MTKEELIEEVKNRIGYESDYECYRMSNSERDFYVDILKVLEREPKTGHWILDETDNSITCVKCGCLIWANDIHHGEAYYCPNCGSRNEVSE